MRVGRPSLRVCSESLSPSLGSVDVLNRSGLGVDTVRIEEREEYTDVFHACIHTLSVKRYHGVGSVTEDHNARAVMVWCAREAYEGKVWVRSELLEKGARGYEIGYQARNMILKE